MFLVYRAQGPVAAPCRHAEDIKRIMLMNMILIVHGFAALCGIVAVTILVLLLILIILALRPQSKVS